MPCKIAFVDKLHHSANVFKLTSFFVGQRHNNSIANATAHFLVPQSISYFRKWALVWPNSPNPSKGRSGWTYPFRQ